MAVAATCRSQHTPRRSSTRGASLLVLASVLSVQSGQALGKTLFEAAGGPAGVVTLRLGIAALVLLALQRRPLPADPHDRRLVALLGTAIAGMNLIYPALSYLAVGVAVCLQYLGPLAVALAGARRRRDLGWAVLAGAGVLLLSAPGGPLPLTGMVLALVSGTSMGAYVLLNQRAGARTADGSLLAWATAWAAVLSMPTGLAPAARAVTHPDVLVVAAVVAVLSAVVPYSLDLLALRRLPARAAAVLQSLEPLAGALAGLVLLGEVLTGGQWLGVGCVAVASTGAALLTGAPRTCRPAPVRVRRGVSSNARADHLPVIDDFDELVRLVTEREHLYVRYSKGPAHDGDGPSHDYESGVDMPGLSVTPIAPEPWWPRPAEDWIARRLCKYEELGQEQDRFPWLLFGHVAGYGPDHEPLLVDVEPVARVGPKALSRARQLYDERFTVAQDSRG
ncbi:MAG: DUF6098 family protein [Actinomycetota bacterium]|nr:DUF6098 family protein [Actinomycetota bacterium]